MSEFNIINDFMQYQNEKNFYNSSYYKTLKEKKIDTAQLEGLDPDPEAGLIKFNKDLPQEEKDGFLSEATDVLSQILKEDVIAIARGGVNSAKTLNTIASFLAYGNDPLPEDSMFKFVNEKADAQLEQLDKQQEELNNPFLTQLQGYILQDAAYTVPIYNKLKKFLPKTKALVISSALGGAMSFGSEDSLLVDTKAVNGLKDITGIDDNTPAGEMYDKIMMALEFSSLGFGADGIFKGLSKLKNADTIPQLATTTAATAGVAGVTPEAEASPLGTLIKQGLDQGTKKLVGISKQQGKEIPTTFEQKVFSKKFEDQFINDPNVLNFKVDDSFGKFGDDVERNLDVEILTTPNFDEQSLVKKAVQAAADENQEAVFVAKSTLDQNIGSPSLSINFKQPMYKSQIEDMIGVFQNEFGFNEGFTAKTKLLKKDGLPFTMQLAKPDLELVENIKKLYPVTDDYTKGGFLLPDGTVVNMNRHTNNKGGAVEHRDAAVRAMGGQKPGNAEQLYDFMNKTGAIRISPMMGRMFGQVYHKPTKAQLRTLQKMNEAGFNEMIFDAYDPGMGFDANLFINKPERSVNKIFELQPGDKFNAADIEKAFDTQAIDTKEYEGIRSLFIPDFSNSTPQEFIDKILMIDQKYGKDLNVDPLELFDLTVINKKDYGKYK